eukprot:scaffold234233_cov15-Tisochrysis_lutea.AAC.1
MTPRAGRPPTVQCLPLQCTADHQGGTGCGPNAPAFPKLSLRPNTHKWQVSDAPAILPVVSFLRIQFGLCIGTMPLQAMKSCTKCTGGDNHRELSTVVTLCTTLVPRWKLCVRKLITTITSTSVNTTLHPGTMLRRSMPGQSL